MTTKKILHVISSANPLGGGPIEGINSLYKILKKENYEIHCLTCDSPSDPWVKNNEMNIIATGPSLWRYAYNSRLLTWLKENHNKYEVVIVNGIWQYPSFAVWITMSGKKTPYFVFTHGMLDPWFKKKYPLKHLKKWMYWPWGEYRVLRDAKGVVFTCEEEKLLAKKSFWINKWNELVVSYGVYPPPIESESLKKLFLDKYPELLSKRIFLFVGRITEKKGCDLLLDAFAQEAYKNPELHLVMAGPDNDGLLSVLKNRSKKLNIERNITWTGMLEGKYKWGAYYSAEAFCLPSHQENFGIVVVEALACGCPVLISNKINIWREINSFGAGIVGDDTLQGTHKTLSDWLSFSNEEKKTMREATVKCYSEKFSIDSYVNSFKEMIIL